MRDEELENLVVELAEDARSRYFGKYRGVVRETDDPDHLGRVTAMVPEIYGDQQESPWALPVAAFAGPDHGLVLIPEAGDGVWIEFEAGDISRPLWTGGWWGEDEMPAPAGPQTRVLASTAGHKLVLDDEGGEVQLLHSGGGTMTMTDDEITIKIGSTEIKLTQNELTLKSGSAQIRLSSSGVDINNGAFKVI